MLQIKNLSMTHKKDLRTIISDFSVVLNDGDKAVIIGEEGNGKSTLIKGIYNPSLVDDYIEAEGEIVTGKERMGYLPQEMPDEDKEKTIYEYFSGEELFWNKTPKELSEIARKFGMTKEIFYSEQKMGSLSGGEKVKVQLMRLFIQEATVLLLDEPSNDIDIATLELLEKIINEWEHIVLFISHDETLIEHTANMVIHIEQIVRKTKPRYTIAKLPYRRYVEERIHKFESQERQALNDRKAKMIRDEKYRRVMQSVQNALDNCSRQAPSVSKNLKDKMHTIKSMGRRFEKEDENMTEMPEQEEAIFFKLGDKDSCIPNGKTVIDYTLSKLMTADGKRVLSENINLRIRGAEKICIIGTNGAGKTTFLRNIVEELLKREDIKAEYMPQNYEEILDLDMTPVDFLAVSGDKEERTRIRTYLGSLKYTADEMEHSMRELSGGQKAKVLLLHMSLSGANVLILDEPTRNFSPLSGPVIREILREFPGAIISISHDRKYIDEVCDKVYELSSEGLTLLDY
ncbi:MAG: ABC-F family ATP-binding cassette domain-containing protein [Ruminococcaceae bacterium]|nr:ABC-F family ATP-binding cassette domain-containing protein [Oscillospiraceae bacterium]